MAAKFLRPLLAAFARLTKNVLDAFERRRDRDEVVGWANTRNRLGPSNGIHDIIAIGCKHCIHYVVRKAATFTQIKFETLAEEISKSFRGLVELAQLVLEFRCGAILFQGLMKDRADPEGKLMLGQNPHNPVRLPPQREWILRSARLQPEREHPGNAVRSEERRVGKECRS